MKKNWLNNIIIGVVSISAVIIILTEKNMDFPRLLQMIGIIPIMLVPKLLRKLFHMELANSIETLYLIFIVLAYFLGIALGFYGKYAFYDKFVHLLSGIMSSFLALILLVKLKKYENKSIAYNILFIIMVTLSVAALWEFFEFTCDNVFHRNAQRVPETGVADTMQDMISAFLGSLLFSVTYAYEMLSKKRGIITRFIASLK